MTSQKTTAKTVPAVSPPVSFAWCSAVEGAPSVTRTAFQYHSGNLNQVLGTAGVKFPVAAHLLITANALFSLNDAGLKANVIPVIGLEYVFPRH